MADRALTLQLTGIPAETIHDYYLVSDQGLFAENQSPQPYYSDTSPSLMQYQLDFSVMPTKGGFGYTVLSDTLGSGIYIFRLTSLASATLDPNFAFDEWHKVSTFVNTTQIEVSIDNYSLMDLTQTSAFAGSFGFGASFGQSAYSQNVTLQSLQGQLIYNASLTQSSVPKDFLSGTNPESVAVDGAWRDRITSADAGDVDITVGPMFASINGIDFINGTLNLLGLIGYSDWDYYDPAQSGAVAKFNTVHAFALQQALPLLNAANVTTKTYADRLAALKSAINEKLWNPTLNAYQLPDSVQDTLAQLFLPAGALAFSNCSLARGFKQTISPYSSGYHLRAASTVTSGFAQWKVLPQTLGLSWANGTHPTPHGDLAVSWAVGAEGKFSMNVTSPTEQTEQ
ncbi:hypothetical protein BPAE_0044g00480 [Botrytis paeoniae]|uniref:Alpha-L-rhamnosidase C-terminal domain-containing protein n=1 Tax=Botrytis paeoniae TaxID=278948 RepID=A0A4Z1FYW3_9HELO|nr:hypothetical protein BPAE_0044g00480 [Botrytis paeoniae]